VLTDEIGRLWLETRRALASENNPPPPALLLLEFGIQLSHKKVSSEGPNAPVMVVEAKHIISSPANRRKVGGGSVRLQARTIG
jgi:hypothetical protein